MTHREYVPMSLPKSVTLGNTGASLKHGAKRNGPQSGRFERGPRVGYDRATPAEITEPTMQSAHAKADTFSTVPTMEHTKPPMAMPLAEGQRFMPMAEATMPAMPSTKPIHV